MTDHGCHAADVCPEVTCDGPATGARGVRLRDVRDHDSAPCRRPQNPAGVDRARVAASALSQVHSAAGREPRDDVGRLYGAEEIAEPEGGEEADAAHEGRIMRVRALAGVTGAGIVLWALVVRGSLAPDLGIGRRFRRLGPSTVRIAAPREVVFDVVSGPYLGRTPRALGAKLEVLERGRDVVLAAHHTRAYGLTVTTIETVRFEPPERVHFRLLRGPVPHVLETFELREVDGATELEYTGELGTDLWVLGSLWGAAVARTWEATVAASLEAVRAEAERRAAPR